MLLHVFLSVGLYAIGISCASYETDKKHIFENDFCFDADRAQLRAWMGDVPDEVHLTSLSIPGTHETMTHRVEGNLQCQNWDLMVQLHAGVRYVDIRARVRDDKLYIYHAKYDTGYSFQNVLVTVFDFLDANPSEAIVMRLREEESKMKKKNSHFEKALQYALEKSPATAPRAAKHFWHYNYDEPIPTLGQLRSRVLLLQNFKTEEQKQQDNQNPHPPESKGNYGIAWHGKRMVIQDDWKIRDAGELPKKWNSIRESLVRATSGPLDNLLYVSHTSATGGRDLEPIEAAAGPINGPHTGMNELTAQWISKHENDKKIVPRLGVVVYDFPGRKAIEAVVAWNKRIVKHLASDSQQRTQTPASSAAQTSSRPSMASDSAKGGSDNTKNDSKSANGGSDSTDDDSENTNDDSGSATGCSDSTKESRAPEICSATRTSPSNKASSNTSIALATDSAGFTKPATITASAPRSAIALSSVFLTGASIIMAQLLL